MSKELYENYMKLRYGMNKRFIKPDTWKPNKLVISTSMRGDWEIIRAYNPEGYGLAMLRGAREHKIIYATTQIIGRLLKNSS